ncbi:MAG: threonine--tRNA ligase [Ruminococcaceae bacterium]|nr:threonine--tRNA ligase [Oscillospiraceae bacterium]
MAQIKFSSGEVFSFEGEVSVYEAAQSLGIISREVITCKVNGELTELSTKVSADADVQLLTFKDEDGKHVFRHTAAHIMAQAVKRLYPNTKQTIGPATDTGFFQDFDSEIAFTPEILKNIEAEMKKIVKENLLIEKSVLDKEEAIKLMTELDEPYKVERITELGDDATLTFYKQGEYIDLCAGPHLHTTGAVKAFKLTQCTGAYYKGDQNNKMLQRIYGIAFPTKDELTAYVTQQEEALKRDHNKIGRELEYFTTVDSIGQGLPILLPKGARTIQRLQRWVEDEEEKRGYLLTKTPLMAKRELYKISGHWDHYLDGMFVMGDPDDYTKECFALRPMTCPFQYQVFLNKKRSYRELPMRLGETSTLFRNEDSGEMHGLIRVRQFTISEGHLVLRPEQLAEEFKGCLELAKHCLETIGLWEDCSFRFSQWDPKRTDKYEGTPEQWEEAQSIMGELLDSLLGRENYAIGIDEAAFYGPKLDIQCKNVFGKEDTIVTIQIDMLLAKKFGMEYVDRDNTMKTPYIIHRTSLGCYERTLALILEKYAGALPVWLAPTQVTVIPVVADFADYAAEVAKKMESAGIRVELDDRNEKLGYRIREAQLSKVPYMLVVGEDEMKSNSVTARARVEGEGGKFTVDEFIAKVVDEINTKKH